MIFHAAMPLKDVITDLCQYVVAFTYSETDTGPVAALKEK